MSRRVPRGGLGPEWPDEPDDGQAYGDQGVQHNGYRPNGYNGYNGNGNGNGAPGQDQQQHQYGQYGGPGRGGPADYGQQQPYGGQGGNGHGPQGYDQPGPPPGPGQGQGYDNQPTQTFNYQRGGAAYQGNGGQRGYNGDPRGYQNGGAQGNMRRYEGPQRYDDQRYDDQGTTTRATTTGAMRCRGGGLVARHSLSSHRRTRPRPARCASAVRAGCPAVAPFVS